VRGGPPSPPARNRSSRCGSRAVPSGRTLRATLRSSFRFSASSWRPWPAPSLRPVAARRTRRLRPGPCLYPHL